MRKIFLLIFCAAWLSGCHTIDAVVFGPGSSHPTYIKTNYDADEKVYRIKWKYGLRGTIELIDPETSTWLFKANWGDEEKDGYASHDVEVERYLNPFYVRTGKKNKMATVLVISHATPIYMEISQTNYKKFVKVSEHKGYEFEFQARKADAILLKAWLSHK